ncbi:heterokaryon incompatibility protein-domain-containing protein [Xylariaceae sp. FL0804]|nr:heterokaryon incompatibility protein-domain-containing protein [Xylariaceae sp. FL0804]
MTEPSGSIYEPLPTSTSIRVLILAPGARDDDDLFCWLVGSDLDCDPRRSLDTGSSGEGSRSSESSTKVFRGRTPDGQVREFPVPLDYAGEPDADAPSPETRLRRHPFQKYKALSYVWGETSNPKQVMLNGLGHVNVTRNLYDFLRSLRESTVGSRLWVDALCINQGDSEEKSRQIPLMRRIYQQAELVYAYVPLPLSDAAMLFALGQGIIETGRGCEAEWAKYQPDFSSTDTGLYFDPRIVEDKLQRQLDGLGIEGHHHQEETTAPSSEKRRLFLEDFGIPPADHPAWAVWRRFITSDYFSRIWILQELCLAPSPSYFWLGQAGINVQSISDVYGTLVQYSGAANLDYMIPPDARMVPGEAEEDDEEEEAGAGARARAVWLSVPPAHDMFGQRLRMRREGEAGVPQPRDRLIDVLRVTLGFRATDPRDRIYGVLGLATDGDDFAEHVSYAADETYTRTFFRFARLFVERGDAFPLLLQVEMFEPDTEKGQLPSWVPRWMMGTRRGMDLRLSDSLPAQIQVLLDDWTLKIRGVLVDEIEHLELVLNAPRAEGDSDSEDPTENTMEGVLQELFDVLTQPPPASLESTADVDNRGTLGERPFTGEEEEEREREKQEAGEEPDAYDIDAADNAQIWRDGFRWYCRAMAAWQQTGRPFPDDRFWAFASGGGAEVRMFLRRVGEKTTDRHLCVSRAGRVGIVPRAAAVGDRIALFDGCDNAFVLRRAAPGGGAEGRHGSAHGGSRREESYGLVGAGYFAKLRGGLRDCPDAKHEDIFLV